MKNNPFKNFTAYVVPPEFVTELQDFAYEHPDAETHLRVRDPQGSEWRHIGLANLDGEWFSSLQGIGVLMCVGFNERILPAAVRDEHLAVKIADITERGGYKPGRKQIAELKEEVTFELLPKAFIKRSFVAVMFLRPHWLFVFTSSTKRADDTLAVLRGVFNWSDRFIPHLATPTKSSIDSLSAIARTTLSPEDEFFEADSAAVLKGENKRTIRIKDRDIYGDEVQEILTTGYDVHELRLNYWPDGRGVDEIGATLTLNDKMIFKSVLLADQRLSRGQGEEDAAADFHSFAWVVGEEYRQLASCTFDAMGGLRMPEWPDRTDGTTSEDDEL